MNDNPQLTVFVKVIKLLVIVLLSVRGNLLKMDRLKTNTHLCVDTMILIPKKSGCVAENLALTSLKAFRDQILSWMLPSSS